MTVELHLGDCLEVMKSIPDKSIDAVITDPPYFLPQQSYVGSRENGYAKRHLGDMSVFDGYFQTIFEQVGRILSDEGTSYIFCDAQSYPFFFRSMYSHFNHVRTPHLVLCAKTACRGLLQKDRVHPAEKPVALIEKLIKKHEYTTILDPFMGSGTTGVACVQTGRNFIGIEIDEGYFKIAEKRIHDAQQQMRLPI